MDAATIEPSQSITSARSLLEDQVPHSGADRAELERISLLAGHAQTSRKITRSSRPKNGRWVARRTPLHCEFDRGFHAGAILDSPRKRVRRTAMLLIDPAQRWVESGICSISWIAHADFFSGQEMCFLQRPLRTQRVLLRPGMLSNAARRQSSGRLLSLPSRSTASRPISAGHARRFPRPWHAPFIASQ